jgi:hypothetical protein
MSVWTDLVERSQRQGGGIWEHTFGTQFDPQFWYPKSRFTITQPIVGFKMLKRVSGYQKWTLELGTKIARSLSPIRIESVAPKARSWRARSCFKAQGA